MLGTPWAIRKLPIGLKNWWMCAVCLPLFSQWIHNPSRDIGTVAGWIDKLVKTDQLPKNILPGFLGDCVQSASLFSPNEFTTLPEILGQLLAGLIKWWDRSIPKELSAWIYCIGDCVQSAPLLSPDEFTTLPEILGQLLAGLINWWKQINSQRTFCLDFLVTACSPPLSFLPMNSQPSQRYWDSCWLDW